MLLLPRSQHTISAVRGMGEVFGTSDLPGSVTVDRCVPHTPSLWVVCLTRTQGWPLICDGLARRLQEGSAIVLHSGLLHARRPKPGGGVRYFVDVEYVQPGPHRWPAYLDEAQHQDICEIGRALPGNKSPQVPLPPRPAPLFSLFNLCGWVALSSRIAGAHRSMHTCGVTTMLFTATQLTFIPSSARCRASRTRYRLL